MARFRGHWEGLSRETVEGDAGVSDYDFMAEQVDFFFGTALATFEKHTTRWLEELVDCSCAHPNPDVALAVMAHLLAVRDGVAPPVIPEGKEVEVHGETVKLSKLVASVTQFVTVEILEKKSALFWDDVTVEDIRECVKNGGAFLGPSGARLKSTFAWRVLGRVIHSQGAERLVNAGKWTDRKYASNERESSHTERLVQLVNFSRPDWHEAVYEYFELGKPEDVSKILESKRRNIDGRKERAASQLVRNKAVIALAIMKSYNAKAAIPKETLAIAQEAAQKRKADGTDLDAEARRRKEARYAEVVANDAKRVVAQDDDARAKIAASPTRLLLGMIDLDDPPSKAVLALECELRDLEAKRNMRSGEATDAVGTLVARLREYHHGASLIDKRTDFEDGKKMREFATSILERCGAATSDSASSSSSAVVTPMTLFRAVDETPDAAGEARAAETPDHTTTALATATPATSDPPSPATGLSRSVPPM